MLRFNILKESLTRKTLKEKLFHNLEMDGNETKPKSYRERLNTQIRTPINELRTPAS